jgi:predicted dehydrogenase
MNEFGWALVGPGRIARRFAAAVQGLEATRGSRLCAVYARDLGKAHAFAKEWRPAAGAAPVATDDLAGLLADPRVDGIYIATPHAQHGAFIRAALLAGKPVLCEKPLVPTHREGAELVALARQRGVFLMEAVWTRFLPIYSIVGQWLRDRRIGALRGIQSSFCFPAPYDPLNRCFNPALAGGALLDIGIYNLTVSRWVMEQALGACPPLESMVAGGVLAPTGVDVRVNATLNFPGGLAAQFICAFDTSSDNALHILGSEGRIVLPLNFHQSSEALLMRHGEAPQRVEAPHRINGFEGEIEEAEECIRAGVIESPRISHAETLVTLQWMDEIRRQLGVVYPFE